MPKDPNDLRRMLNADGSGRVTLITGAGSTRGFGRTSALLLAKHGARVIVTDLPQFAEQGRKTVQEIRQAGGQAEWYPLDVTSEVNWAQAIELWVFT